MGRREPIQLVVRAGLELGASELQVRRSNRSATLPESDRKELRQCNISIVDSALKNIVEKFQRQKKAKCIKI